MENNTDDITFTEGEITTDPILGNNFYTIIVSDSKTKIDYPVLQFPHKHTIRIFQDNLKALGKEKFLLWVIANDRSMRELVDTWRKEQEYFEMFYRLRKDQIENPYDYD